MFTTLGLDLHFYIPWLDAFTPFGLDEFKTLLGWVYNFGFGFALLHTIVGCIYTFWVGWNYSFGWMNLKLYLDEFTTLDLDLHFYIPWLDAFTPFGLDEIIHLVGWIYYFAWLMKTLTWLIFVCLFACLFDVFCFVLLPIWASQPYEEEDCKSFLVPLYKNDSWRLTLWLDSSSMSSSYMCGVCLFFFVFWVLKIWKIIFYKKKEKEKLVEFPLEKQNFPKLSQFLYLKNGKISTQNTHTHTHTHTKHVWNNHHM